MSRVRIHNSYTGRRASLRIESGLDGGKPTKKAAIDWLVPVELDQERALARLVNDQHYSLLAWEVFYTGVLLGTIVRFGRNKNISAISPKPGIIHRVSGTTILLHR